MLMPYLAFAGNCEEAFAFYVQVLGGELQHLSKYAAGEPFPPALWGKVMHATLALPGGAMISGGDSPAPVTKGNALQLQMHFDDEKEACRLFAALAEGGEVIAELAHNPPPDDASMAGALVDRYGLPWIVSVAAERKA